MGSEGGTLSEGRFNAGPDESGFGVRREVFTDVVSDPGEGSFFSFFFDGSLEFLLLSLELFQEGGLLSSGEGLDLSNDVSSAFSQRFLVTVFGIFFFVHVLEELGIELEVELFLGGSSLGGGFFRGFRPFRPIFTVLSVLLVLESVAFSEGGFDAGPDESGLGIGAEMLRNVVNGPDHGGFLTLFLDCLLELGLLFGELILGGFLFIRR